MHLANLHLHHVAKQALALIQALYKVEEEAKADPKIGRPAMTPEQRFSLRLKKSAPILAELKTFVDKHIALVRPTSATGVALGYCLGEWPNFIRFMEDGRIEIDNGQAERAIRPLALGRRNWLFADTVAGANASAIIFSLVETAKLNSREPRRYLQYVIRLVADLHPQVIRYARHTIHRFALDSRGAFRACD